MGKLIVIEGTDGSGKSTQFRLLTEHLERDHYEFQKLVFPQYDKPSSALIRMYLGGEFGSKPGDVNAYAASAFYAVDRYASYKQGWGTWYEEGGLILSDRYTTSNMFHQCTKEPKENWDSYLSWLEDLEYEKVGLPRPTQVIYLDVEPEVSRALLSKRYEGDESKKDIHEANFAYLLRCREAALYAAEKFGWKVIACNKGSEMRSIEDISEEIWNSVKVYFE